jgi:hypothetical protein
MKRGTDPNTWLWGLLVAGGVSIVAAGWAAFNPLPSDSRELVYVIPKGNWARRVAGENIQAVPSQIHLTLGVKDILVLKNHDDVPQMFGPVLIMPGETFQLPFRKASNYQFLCTLHASGQLSVIVEPMPEVGWQRFRWRVLTLVGLASSHNKGDV